MTHEELHNSVLPRMICDDCAPEDEEIYWRGSADSMCWAPSPDLSGVDERL